VGIILKDSGARESFGGAVRDTREGKGRFDLIPPEVLVALAHVFEAGAKKYGDRNWEAGIPIPRHIDSCLRHLGQYQMGQSEEPHLWLALTNLAMAVTMDARYGDDATINPECWPVNGEVG